MSPFTPEQLEHFHQYEAIRAGGTFNMLDLPHTLPATGLTRKQYVFVMMHYSALQTIASVSVPPKGYTADELERDNPYNQWMYES